MDAGAQLALAQAGARRPSTEKAPKISENHGETMGQMHKNVGFTRKMLVSPIFLCSMVSFSGFEVWKWGLLGFLSSKGGIFAMKDGDLIRT